MIIKKGVKTCSFEGLTVGSFLFVMSPFSDYFPFFTFNFWFYSSCLADIIFLIYIYQRWVYPVDKKRVNEFGFGGEADQAPDQVIEQVTDGTEDTAVKEEEKKTNWADVL